jgi:four helix bundle protein
MEKITRVDQMPVYQLFRQLARDVEAMTRGYGPEFRWLRVQCLRSSESVCANMTEGFYSQYSTEYLQGLYRSRREARETMCHMEYAVDVKQLSAQSAQTLTSGYEDACLQLSNVIGGIERKISDRGKAKVGSAMVREEPIDYVTSTFEVDPGINHQP